MSVLRGLRKQTTRTCRNLLNFFTVCAQDVSKEAAPDTGTCCTARPLHSSWEAHTGVWKECSLKPTFLLLLFWSLSEKRALTTGLSFVWRTQSSFSQLLTGKGLSEKFLSQSQGMKVGREEQISSLCCKVKTPDS